ncbi:hypothetical protein [Amaricoccus macauensis]|uniref:hypothetical protein n=1 Tax=Amaricoccus macauensis TaxID=57001 RepID=UPI003C7B0A87
MKGFAGVFLAVAAFATPAAAADELWVADGFDMPESAVVDPARGRIILSVIGGDPTAADGNGGLVLLSSDGAVLDANWTTGLDAPKGLAIVDDVLLVADLTRLHEVDLTSGEVLRSIEVEDAVFLNDITSDGKGAFVSDMMAHSLWRYEDGEMTLWLQDARLSHPNGVYWDRDRLLVGSWGEGIAADFTTEVPGSLLAIDPETQAIRVVVPELGNLDGITRAGDALLVNDWITGALFEIGADGTASVVDTFAPGLADISSDGNVLHLPMMLEGRLVAKAYP